MSNQPYILIPKVKLTPSYIALFNQCEWQDVSKRRQRSEYFRPPTRSPDGLISDRSASKIKKAISWFLYLAQEKELPSSYHGKTFAFKLSFITLTLSAQQKHSDQDIKAECLNQFLVEARKRWKVHHYLWRAEPQCNGNIHFHILCDKFIPWSELRDTWNRIQNKLGYVDRYRDQMREFHRSGFQVRQDLLKKWSYKNQIRAYRTGSKKDWNSPNSTDIHSVWKIKNLPAYLAKYCTKNQKGRKIEGNLWNLSESLSKINGAVDVVDSFFDDEISRLLESHPSQTHHYDYYSIITIPIHTLQREKCFNLHSLFTTYINQYRDLYS